MDFGRLTQNDRKIRVKRGRTRKFKNEGNAKLGGLVKELGFQIGLGFAASLEEPENWSRKRLPPLMDLLGYIGDYATKTPISLLLFE